MTATELASPPSPQRRDWRRIFGLPGAFTAVAFLGNELLMAATPWHPIFWAFAYFPLKALGIPLCGFFEAAKLITDALRTRSHRSVLRLAGVVVVGVIVWLNFQYDPIAAVELLGCGTSREAT